MDIACHPMFGYFVLNLEYITALLKRSLVIHKLIGQSYAPKYVTRTGFIPDRYKAHRYIKAHLNYYFFIKKLILISILYIKYYY